MSVLALRLQKHLDTSLGAVATLRRLTDGTGRPVDRSKPFDVVVPASDHGEPERVPVEPGIWLVEAMLPSGEIVTEQVAVGDKEVAVTFSAAERSPEEWLGWQHLLGNIEGKDTLRLMRERAAESSPREWPGWRRLLSNIGDKDTRRFTQERARRAVEALAHQALGRSAPSGLIDNFAAATAQAASVVLTLLVLPVGLLLRLVAGGEKRNPATVRDQSTTPSNHPTETVKDDPGPGQMPQPVVRLVTVDGMSALAIDPWTTVLSNTVDGLEKIPAQGEAESATWVYKFERNSPQAGPDHPFALEPRAFASVTWRGKRCMVALPLPWPAIQSPTPVPVQIMVRRSPSDEEPRIGVAVMDKTFGPLSGFMTASTLSKAVVVVEKAYDLLFVKTENPLAAAAGAYILVAAGDPRDWRTWIANLEQLAPTLPDVAVLHGTLLLRSAEDQSTLQAARAAFLRAVDCGIPYYSLGVSWLLDGLTVFSGDPEIDAKMMKVRRLAQRLDVSQAFTVVRLSEDLPPAKETPNLPAVRQPAPANPDGGPSAMKDTVTPTTFTTVELNPEATASLDLPEYVRLLVEKLEKLKDERTAYYQLLRRSNSAWANGSRRLLALLGSAAFLLTAAAAALRFAPPRVVSLVPVDDRALLLLVLAIYAVMGTLAFYEKATDRTASYFRHLSVVLGIRDLWTKFQFELLKELTALRNASDKAAALPATRDKIGALAEAFCADLDKASTAELSEWRTEFQTSLSELSDVARKGSEDVTQKLQESVKAAEKAAADAKLAAETAAKAAAQAANPGSFNVTITGEFDDQVVLSVDGVEVARSSGKSIAIARVAQGMRIFSAEAQKGPKKLQASQMVEVKPGLQELKLTLT